MDHVWGSTVAVRNVVAPASHLKSATHEMSTFCEVTRGVGGMWLSCPTFLQVCRLGAKGNGFVVMVDFQLTFSLLVVELEDCQHCLCNAELNFQVHFRLPCHCFTPLPLFFSSPWAWMSARSLAYAHFLETMAGRSEIQMLKRCGARTDTCGTPFLRRRNLLRLPLALVRVKLWLPTPAPWSSGASACQVSVAATSRYNLL